MYMIIMISNSVSVCEREKGDPVRLNDTRYSVDVSTELYYMTVSCDHCRHFTVKAKYSYLLHKSKHSCRYQSLFHVENGEVRIRNDKVCV